MAVREIVLVERSGELSNCNMTNTRIKNTDARYDKYICILIELRRKKILESSISSYREYRRSSASWILP